MQDFTALARILANQGPLQRTATVHGIDPEARTVELAFSSETDTVERTFGIEILGHGPGECDLSRLQNGAPVLRDHNWGDQRGVVVSARIDADRVGRAVVRFSRSPEGDQLFQDILDGIVTKVSVGYVVNDVQRVGERDGVGIYRVTAWQPHEISMVSVPADDTVGVGRAAEPTGNLVTRSLTGAGRGSRTPKNELEQLLHDARNAPGDKAFFDGNGDVRGVHRQRPVVRGFYSIGSLGIPNSAMPGGVAAAKKTTLSSAILAAGRVFAAGAQLAVVPSAGKQQLADDGRLYSSTQETRFDVIQAANFAKVVDGDDLTTSPLSVQTAYADLDMMPAYGVRIELPRADQRKFPDCELSATALNSIAMGIARLADKVLLERIALSEPAPFTIGGAAALDVEFGVLRALVGTEGAGALVGQDGVLRAQGVPASLTADAGATFIGAFPMAAVALYEDITLIAERRSLDGKLEVTCWVNLLPLLPAPAAFWTVEN